MTDCVAMVYRRPGKGRAGIRDGQGVVPRIGAGASRVPPIGSFDERCGRGRFWVESLFGAVPRRWPVLPIFDCRRSWCGLGCCCVMGLSGLHVIRRGRTWPYPGLCVAAEECMY